MPLQESMPPDQLEWEFTSGKGIASGKGMASGKEIASGKGIAIEFIGM
jgi:hypothetical protein